MLGLKLISLFLRDLWPTKSCVLMFFFPVDNERLINKEDPFVPDLHDRKGEVKAARTIGIVLNKLILLL